MGRILALDYGSRRVGWAISDRQGLIIHKMNTIIREQPDNLQNELSRLIKEYEIETIVIGYPKNMDGTAGPKAQEVDQVAEDLAKRYKRPVIKWDERLTSVMAGKMSRDQRKKVRQDKARIDSLSAGIILAEYLAWQKG